MQLELDDKLKRRYVQVKYIKRYAQLKEYMQ
jgi:hypothetical protein